MKWDGWNLMPVPFVFSTDYYYAVFNLPVEGAFLGFLKE